MKFGYTGRILHVDLSRSTLEVEQPPEDFYRAYVGGSALGLYYLLKHTPPGTSPFGEENTLVFALSGLTGAPVSGQSRCTVTAKSPLTGGAGDSQCGGFWPAELKFAGFDAIVVRGVSPHPVYLWIKDSRSELRSAEHLWGKTTGEVETILKEELGDERIEVAQIGPSGEKLVRFAAIINHTSRAHGRTGMGAVMGSKRLKAIAVCGSSKKLAMENPKALNDLAKAAAKNIFSDEDVEDLAIYGTAGIVESQNAAGGLVRRNWQSGYTTADRAEVISGKRLYDQLLLGADGGSQMRDGRDTCYACAVRCKRVVEADWLENPIQPKFGGPEYETIATFGSYCDVDDLYAIAYANQLCNQYGVDTISAGATIAFAIDCFENGLISEKDTGGINLRWGNAEAMIVMLERTLKREGFGDILAEGSARAAQIIGGGAEKFVMAAKNQELPAHMPQVKRSLALIYAVNPFGADHQSSEHDPAYEPEIFETQYEKYGKRLAAIGLTDPQVATNLSPEKVSFTLNSQYAYSALDTFNVCQFVFGPAWQLMGMDDLAKTIRAVVGWEMSIEEIQKIGRRRLNMLRAFNSRESFTRENDTLPERLFDLPLTGGPSDGVALDRDEFNKALDLYYRLAGWDAESGNPTPDTLEELGLGWV